MAREQWYYCLEHETVEPYEGCKAANRLGPYETKADAADALERVAQRNTDWDEDPRFNDEDDDEDTRWDGAPAED